jgi:hypothetical protein
MCYKGHCLVLFFSSKGQHHPDPDICLSESVAEKESLSSFNSVQMKKEEQLDTNKSCTKI